MNLWNKSFNSYIEKTVTKYIGREWRVRVTNDLAELAYHPCAILSDSIFSVFAKYSDAPDGALQFETEKAGLDYLSAYAHVMVPTSIGIVPTEDGTLFIMEAIDEIERKSLQWKQIGRTLARIHRIKNNCCGFQFNNYFGPLHQDNTPIRDWVTFYGEYRLIPRLKMAFDSGNLSYSTALQVEKIINRLPELCGPEIKPSLLHGDAQKNNFISSRQGSFVIDPAVYYGNPEIDLAYLDFFEPVPEDVFEGYKEEMPIEKDFLKDAIYGVYQAILLLSQ